MNTSILFDIRLHCTVDTNRETHPTDHRKKLKFFPEKKSHNCVCARIFFTLHVKETLLLITN